MLSQLSLCMDATQIPITFLSFRTVSSSVFIVLFPLLSIVPQNPLARKLVFPRQCLLINCPEPVKIQDYSSRSIFFWYSFRNPAVPIRNNTIPTAKSTIVIHGAAAPFTALIAEIAYDVPLKRMCAEILARIVPVT